LDFSIADHTSYLVVAGSHAYKTHHQDSDYDVRGWGIPPLKYQFAFDKNFDQYDAKHTYRNYPFRVDLNSYIKSHNLRPLPEDEIIDQTVYSISKFFKLASDCNPNVIELLFVDDTDILICDPYATEVKKHRELFLSARAKFSYLGYAISQLKRIKTHRRWLLNPPKEKPTRTKYGLPEQSLIPPEQRGAAEALVKAKVREWTLQDADLFSKTELNMVHVNHLSEFVGYLIDRKTDIQEMLTAARIAAMHYYGLSKNMIEVLQAEKSYKAALIEWNQYKNWKETRNPYRAGLERDYGYDLKHAMHLVRLIFQGEELLTRGKITVRCNHIPEIEEVKEGKWSYEKLIYFVETKEKEFNVLYNDKKYVVPTKPNIKALSKLNTDLLKRYYHEKIFLRH